MTTEEESITALQDLFHQVAVVLRAPDKNNHNHDDVVAPIITTDQKLRLYGLYKRVTQGTCHNNNNHTQEPPPPPPPVWQMQAYAKYQAWKGCSDLTRHEAMIQYLHLAASLDAKCRALWDAHQPQSSTDEDDNESSEQQPTPPSTTNTHDNDEPEQQPSTADDNDNKKYYNLESEEQCVPRRRSLHTKPSSSFGWHPLEPRGQLDISYGDLWFAARTCLTGGFSSTGRWRQKRDQYDSLCHECKSNIANTTDATATVMVGLSARSLLDLFLLEKHYPAGAEIILAPGINVPGMVHVIYHHQLHIVSIDIPVTSKKDSDNTSSTAVVGVDVEAVQNAVSAKTVAIFVTHAFGILAASPSDMERLQHVCREHDLDLIEDCAETYTGGRPAPSIYADLTLYSFGFIKTSTALGGGVAVSYHRPELLASMQRKQTALYTHRQTTVEYFRLVVTAVFVKFLCDSPHLYGLFYFVVVQMLGWDFDDTVLKFIRGFPTATNKNQNHHGAVDPVMARIRRKPSLPLLALLRRRLRAHRDHDMSPAVRARIKQCDTFASQLSSLSGVRLLEAPPQALETHWLFPVRIIGQEPQQFCEFARRYGWEITRGASQLVCTGRKVEDCPRASAMMKEIVYLPIASRIMAPTKLDDLKALLDKSCQLVSSDGRTWTTDNVNSRDFRLGVLVLAVCWYLNWSAVQRALLFALQAFAVFWVAFVVGCICLQRSMSSFYLRDSKVFAKYSGQISRYGRNCNSLDKDDTREPSKGYLLSAIEVLQLPSATIKSNKKVILTGATGFVGSAVLRDLLQNRKTLGVSKVILICRPKRGVSPQQRIHSLLSDPMFSFLSEEEQLNTVEVINGDVTRENAGIDPVLLEQLSRDTTVSYLIHCAAAVSFTQSLEDAARSNISSALFMQKLACNIANNGIKFVHVSTAFVHGGETGTLGAPLGETLYPLGRFDALQIYQSMTGTQFYASTAMRELGFPNTYAFSKCVCEHLLARSAVETVIIRPSIVGPSLSSPHEGWAGSKPSTLVAGACLYFLYQWNLWLFASHHVVCIPVDVLSRFIVRRSFDKNVHSSCSQQSDGNSSSDDDFEKVSESEVVSISTDSTNLSMSGIEIWNAAWDFRSKPETQFTWMDYALSVFQLGSVFGDFSRPVAYTGLFLLRLLSVLKLTIRQYESLHSLLVVHLFQIWVRVYGFFGHDTRAMKRLESFLNLPKLFFHFMTRDFYFKSSLKAPTEMRGDEYLFSCTVAAHKFASQASSRQKGDKTRESISRYRIAGRLYHSKLADIIWVLTQPIGGIAIRAYAWVVVKILRLVYDEVTVDLESFAALAKEAVYSQIVITPTHRSLSDFILVSFLFFSVPELQVDVPFVAAALEFSQIPVIGWLVQLGQAVFVRRNRGCADPNLRDSIQAIFEKSTNPVIEVFIEGTRSRDRRFLPPKTGFLKCVCDHRKEKPVVVPLTVNHERIAEQERLVRDNASFKNQTIKVSSLLWWLWVSFLA
eukprot:scaffold15108_cov180-Amphora_coffeaeformis.AAC.68